MSDSSTIDGKRFKELFIAGSARLDEAKEYLNSINVFPVPDADTGANMASTMNTAVEALHGIEDHSLKNVLETIEKKLKMEAKGNSGIILSEFFHGMFLKIKKDKTINADNFISAMTGGKEAAYSALAEPKEGTMLTLMSHAVESLKVAEVEIKDMKKALEHMVRCHRKTLVETQEMMPLLKENKVVDSGAHGFLLFWEGALAYMNNEIDHVILKPIHKVFKADKTDQIKYRYCTEALVRKGRFEKDQLQASLAQLGDSLIITGDAKLLKIHIHTNEPETVFAHMKSIGDVIKTKVDDMMGQHQEKVASQSRQAVRIIVDSCSDLDLTMREQWDIEMIPLQVIFGEEAFRDRIDMTADEFYDKLKTGVVIAKTSLPMGSDFIRGFEHVAPHCDRALAIFLSSKLSGTYQAGTKWGSDFDAEKVITYDSRMVSLGAGVMALEAAKMARQGETLERIISRLDEIKSKVSIFFTVDTLEYLAKNGRIGKAQKVIGQMIGVKPILECKDGEVCSHSKTFGRKRVINKLIDILEEKAGGDDFEGAYGVVYSDNPKERDELIDRMRDRLTIKSLIVGQVSPVIGAHVGPGTLGVGCY
ncbi:DegV family protein [hydrothermal vent metagenome]|uniref:DegV family protein n=1 Tax=hydrothermal vent metagenome TaxID=652676 RepID=A0A3B1BS44_9ZZZZ